jgi:hypothetical protein
MMIKEAKDILQAVVLRRTPGGTTARSMAEEQHFIMARTWPLVSLVTNPGRFDDREAKTVRYPGAVANPRCGFVSGVLPPAKLHYPDMEGTLCAGKEDFAGTPAAVGGRRGLRRTRCSAA